MQFWVIQLFPVAGGPSYAHHYLFASPFQAATFADQMRRHNSSRMKVRPATWQEREQAMFQAGLYDLPVWVEEPFWRNYGHELHDHFVHISLADPTAIAFTEDKRKGKADRQTPMKPGKYLQKFMGAGRGGVIEHGPLKGQGAKITKQQVAYYSAWHANGKRPPNDDVLCFATEADEMVRVYKEGPYSCMRGCDKEWEDEDHPVRVYAAGDLQFAYLNNENGDVVGRALCWPDKEVFGRVYPTPNSDKEREQYAELHDRLKALGWVSIDERQNVFEGARLRRMTNSDGNLMMPYLDHEYGVEEVWPGGGGKAYWRMTHDTHHQDNTDGTYCCGDDEDDTPDWTCEECHDGHDDYTSSYTVYSRWRPEARGGRGHPYSEHTWCQSCADYSAFYCDGSDEHYKNDDTECVEAGSGKYEINWFNANGGYQCSWSNEYFFKDDDPPITLTNGALVHPDNLHEAAFQCFFDGQWWPEDFRSYACPAYSSACDVLAVHPLEMEFTLPDQPVHPDDVWAWARGHVLPDYTPPAIQALYQHLTAAA
jgi:hypothetical protein